MAAPGGVHRPYFFLHIPKTGGVTVNALFQAVLPIETIFPPPPQVTLEEADLRQAAARLPHLRYLHGHVDSAIGRHLPLERLRLFCFVRDPLDLLVSHYLYRRDVRDFTDHDRARSLPIDRFLRETPGYLPNPQASMLAIAFGLDGGGVPIADTGLSETCSEAARRLVFMGVTERMDHSVRLMAERFHLPTSRAAHQNAASASATVRAECRALIDREEFHAALRWDATLHRLALARLEDEDRALAWLRQRRAFETVEGIADIHAAALLRETGFVLSLAHGWQPQGWLDGGRSGPLRYWWTEGRTGALLARVAEGRRAHLLLPILRTALFDPAAIRVVVNGAGAAVALVGEGDGAALRLTLDGDALRSGRGFAEIALIAPSALVPPEAPHLPPRGLALGQPRLLSG